MYSYAQTPLNAKVEEVVQQTADWKEEKVTSRCRVHGGERMAAYLFLPNERAAALPDSIIFSQRARAEPYR